MERRWPLHVRPLLFLPGLVLFLLGLWFGLAWLYDSQRFLGTYILRFAISPTLGGGDAAWLAAALLGLVMLVLSPGRGTRAASRGRWAPSMRVYPLMLVLALFLAGFGLFFLFNASYRGGVEGDDYAAYVTLDYAGTRERVAQTVFAFLVLGASLLSLGSAFGAGPSPSVRRRTATRPEPAAQAAKARALPTRTGGTRAQTI